MSTDSTLLKALYAELTDFSSVDVMTREQGRVFGHEMASFASDVRRCIENGHSYDLSDCYIKNVPEGKPQRDYLTLLMSLLELQANRGLNGMSPLFLEEHEEVNKTLRYLIGDVVTEQSIVKPVPAAMDEGPILSIAWGDFVTFKTSGQSPWNEKIIKENERMFQRMLLIFGDVPVRLITKSKVRECLSTLSCFPKGNKKPYNTMTVQQHLDLARAEHVSDEDLVSDTTVKSHLKLMQSFFSAYLTKELDVYAKSPTDAVTWEARANRYGVYSSTEINQLLTLSAQETVGWKRWAVPLLAYTGMRRGELLMIEKAHVITDPQTSIHYIRIPKSKTEAGVRNIPIHSVLLMMGFLDFVRTAKGGELFAEVTHANGLTNFVRNLRDKLEIPEMSHEGSLRLLHSFRHTFITKAREAGQELSLLQVVVGHEGTKTITDHYTHTTAYNLKVLSNVVNAVAYG